MISRNSILKGFAQITLLLALTFVSCGPGKSGAERPGAQEKPNPAESTQQKPSPPSGGNTYNLEKTGEAREEKGLVEPAEGVRFFLKASFRERVVPADFQIGTLQDYFPSDQRKRSVVENATEFLEGLGRGEVIQELIEESRRTLLTRSLAYSMEQGVRPDRFRLGAVEFEDPQDARLAVRLFRAGGASEGWLYLVSREDEGWLITDVHINFPDLESERKRDDGAFKPNRYGRLDSRE